jgi:hypothetical protein
MRLRSSAEFDAIAPSCKFLSDYQLGLSKAGRLDMNEPNQPHSNYLSKLEVVLMFARHAIKALGGNVEAPGEVAGQAVP